MSLGLAFHSMFQNAGHAPCPLAESKGMERWKSLIESRELPCPDDFPMLSPLSTPLSLAGLRLALAEKRREGV